MNRTSVVQVVFWITLGGLAFVLLKRRNDDIDRNTLRLATVIADSSRTLRALDTLPKPFEKLKAPALVSPRKVPEKAKAARKQPTPGDAVTVTVTAYCLSGRTQTGLAPREGIIAADPRVFPMHSEVELAVGRAPAKRYRVEDTGLLIKGRIVDVWLSDCAEALSFGRKRGIATLIPKIRR